MLEELEFLFPVFRCPIRNITRKIDGINSFYYKDLAKEQYGGLCVAESQDPSDFTSELDPDRECDWFIFDPVTSEGFSQRFSSLQSCKNNCRGVNFSVVSGGAALVAASLIAGTGYLTPALGLLFGGAALTGGNMVAQNMCLGPLYCRAGSGQCCPVVLRRG